jgi:hypothetical protein
VALGLRWATGRSARNYFDSFLTDPAPISRQSAAHRPIEAASNRTLKNKLAPFRPAEQRVADTIPGISNSWQIGIATHAPAVSRQTLCSLDPFDSNF